FESYWPDLFAKLAEKINIEDRIVNVGGGGAPAVATPAGGVQLPAAPVAKENK
ncbi:60S acidic ribosomal protein P1-like protein, partial [Tanacetum coccineum]